jgi:hypothetical protein
VYSSSSQFHPGYNEDFSIFHICAVSLEAIDHSSLRLDEREVTLEMDGERLMEERSRDFPPHFSITPNWLLCFHRQLLYIFLHYLTDDAAGQ